MDVLIYFYQWLTQYINPMSAILTLLALAVLYYFWLKPFSARMVKTTDDIQKVASTIADEKGNPILSYKALAEIKEQIALLRDDFDEHCTAAKDHYIDVERIASDELWRSCNVGKCPNLGNIISKLDHVIHIFDSWDDKAEQSRQTTGTTLNNISNQIRDCSASLNSLAQKVIDVLSNAVGGGKKKP